IWSEIFDAFSDICIVRIIWQNEPFFKRKNISQRKLLGTLTKNKMRTLKSGIQLNKKKTDGMKNIQRKRETLHHSFGRIPFGNVINNAAFFLRSYYSQRF